MANKILPARATKARIEEIKGTLETNELVYATDTNELGVKKSDGTVAYIQSNKFTDTDKSEVDKIPNIEQDIDGLEQDIAGKQNKNVLFEDEVNKISLVLDSEGYLSLKYEEV